MPRLIVSIGNSLRRDDGMAHAVVERLAPAPDADIRRVLQLAPELAAELTGYDSVIFIDADINAVEVTTEPVDESAVCPALTHVSRPAEIVRLARSLFGFAGLAFLCRLPAKDLSMGEGPGPQAMESIADAICALTGLLSTK